MTLYVLRHAIAVDPSEWKKKDSERPLTGKGIRRMRKAAKGMKELGISFDWILTSPYKRAFGTAEIIAKAFKARKKLRELPTLASDGDPAHLLQDLARVYRPDATLLLVGHEPFLSRMIGVLIGARTPLSLDLKKGGLCKLTVDKLFYGRCATLEWWLPPKILKALA
jgi:phosphohistidine phosphatase